jgi:hypothetical protein
VIRQQLINTEDICRLRKKAPCTRAEIWIIEKGPSEDEIFSETLFSGMSAISFYPLDYFPTNLDFSRIN